MVRCTLCRLVLVAPLAMAGLAGSAAAQEVRMFDAPPSLEVLRSIMVPESQPGATRRIVIPALPAEAHSVQHAAMPAPAAEPAAAPIAAPAAAPARAPAPAQAQVAAAAAAPAAAPGVVGFRINFPFDSDEIAPAYRGFVERIGELMKTEPQIKLRIEGHTDATGSADYNRDLSVRRAVAVGEHLVGSMGIDPKRLVIVGKGKSEPLTENPFDAQNRRVQFARAE